MANNIKNIVGQYASNGWNEGMLFYPFNAAVYLDAESNGITDDCRKAYTQQYELGRQARISLVLSEYTGNKADELRQLMESGIKPSEALKQLAN